MLKRIEIKVLKKISDERGFFTEIMRRDWVDIFPEEVVQANFSISYLGMVRAGHHHLGGQVDCFVVLKDY